MFGMFDLQRDLLVDHQYDRTPSVPRPGKPIQLRVSVAPGLRDVEVVALRSTLATAREILERGHVIPARRYGSHFEALIPGLADETVVHYVVRASDGAGNVLYADGRKSAEAATVFSLRVTSRRPPAWTRSAVIYQIFVDRFANASGPITSIGPDERGGGDLHGVRNALGYISDLGCDTIWLTPVAKSKSYHGYDVVDLTSVDPRFGGDEALADLVADAHGHGIRVVLDFVPNHISSEHPWFLEATAGGEKRDWFFFRPDGSYDMFFTSHTMPKVNLDHPDARRAMVEAAVYWLDTFGIDGFRIDHVLGPSPSFFAALSQRINAAHPEAWLFGEATAMPQVIRRYGGVMDGATDFGTAYALRDLLRGEIPGEGFAEVEQEAVAVLPHDDFTWVRFVDNHDMDRASWLMDDSHVEQAIRALTALPGVPCLFYGTEQGLRQQSGSDVDGLAVSRVPMRFDSDSPLRRAITEAIALRRKAAPDSTAPIVWSTDGPVAAWRWGPVSGRIAP